MVNRRSLLCSAGIAAVLSLYLWLPLGRCPRDCGVPVPELVAYTRLQGVSPEDAEKMLAWGRSFPCGFCGSRRYLTLQAYSRRLYRDLIGPLP